MEFKSNCLTTSMNFYQFVGVCDKEEEMVAKPICVNSKSGRAGIEDAQPSLQNRIYSTEGTHTAVTTSFLPSIAEPITKPIRIGNIGKTTGQANRVYSVKGKSVCLQSQAGGGGAKTGLYKIDLPDGDYIIRKLTPIEAERLQTLPDNYTEGISDTQRYKCIGNGWTVDVIAHIFSYLREEIK